MAGDILRAPFRLGDTGLVRGLVTDAGFGEARVTTEILVCRFGSIERFFAEEVASTPLAAPVGATDAAKRREMVADLAAALADRTADDGVTFPIESLVLTAAG